MAFSLKQLLFAVVLVSLGLATLLNTGHLWAYLAAYFLYVSLFVLMGYGAWLKEGVKRAFCIGYLAWSLFFSGILAYNSFLFNLTNFITPYFEPDPNVATSTVATAGYTSSAYVPTVVSTPDGQFSLGSSSKSEVTDETNVTVTVPDTGTAAVPANSSLAVAIPAPTSRQVFTQTTTFGESSWYDEIWQMRFSAIFENLATILIGLFGGSVTAFLYPRRERQLKPAVLQSP